MRVRAHASTIICVQIYAGCPNLLPPSPTSDAVVRAANAARVGARVRLSTEALTECAVLALAHPEHSRVRTPLGGRLGGSFAAALASTGAVAVRQPLPAFTKLPVHARGKFISLAARSDASHWQTARVHVRFGLLILLATRCPFILPLVRGEHMPFCAEVALHVQPAAERLGLGGRSHHAGAGGLAPHDD